MKFINNVIIIISILLSIFSFNYLMFIGLIPLLIISFIIRKHNKYLEFVYLLFLLISYVLGFIYDYYDKVYYFDALAHSLFGLVGSIYSLPLLNKLKKYDINSLVFNVFFIIIFTLSLASLWEIFEFTIDRIFENANMQRSLNNTMKDIISAFLFSILYSFVYVERPIVVEKIFIRRN